jgi:hypothetical protein
MRSYRDRNRVPERRRYRSSIAGVRQPRSADARDLQTATGGVKRRPGEGSFHGATGSAAGSSPVTESLGRSETRREMEFEELCGSLETVRFKRTEPLRRNMKRNRCHVEKNSWRS